MAHKFGLKVKAEGVETDLQKQMLKDAGCDYAQGYYYSKSASTDEFETLFKNQQTN